MPRVRIPLLAAACVLVAAPGARADGTGGATPSSPAGGAAYGAALVSAPVARRFAASPARVRADRRATLLVRVEQPGVPRVRARLSVMGRGRRLTVSLGRIRTGRTLRLALPSRLALRPGRYRVLLHVTGAGEPLARSARRRGETTLVVVAAPKPRPKPTPTPPAVPAGPVTASGVFPVAGPHTYGDGLGAARNGHTHQGADILAAEGTPVVAPLAGTILYVDYQPHGAGRYVVQNADDGRAFFFAHCRTNTVAVTPGQRVAAGAPICGVGHTGDAAGPHLHFEIWTGGWRVDSRSTFVDPVPQLRAWDR